MTARSPKNQTPKGAKQTHPKIFTEPDGTAMKFHISSSLDRPHFTKLVLEGGGVIVKVTGLNEAVYYVSEVAGHENVAAYIHPDFLVDSTNARELKPVDEYNLKAPKTKGAIASAVPTVPANDVPAINDMPATNDAPAPAPLTPSTPDKAQSPAKKARPYTQVDEDAMQTYISEYSGKYDIGTLQFCKELVDAKIPELEGRSVESLRNHLKNNKRRFHIQEDEDGPNFKASKTSSKTSPSAQSPAKAKKSKAIKDKKTLPVPPFIKEIMGACKVTPNLAYHALIANSGHIKNSIAYLRGEDVTPKPWSPAEDKILFSDNRERLAAFFSKRPRKDCEERILWVGSLLKVISG